MEGVIAPVCQFCADVTLTVKHVIAVCPQFSNSREIFFPTTVTTNDPDMIMREILAEKEDASYQVLPLINFLKDINMYNEI